MAYEDIGSYTENDPQNDITLAGVRCTFSLQNNHANEYAYDNKGANHFGNFEHDVDVDISSQNNSGTAIIWAVSNDLGDFLNNWSTNDEMCVMFDNDGISLRECKSGATCNDTYATDVDGSGDTYYLKIERTGTTGTCKIYGDAARTNLWDTLTCTVANTQYQYIFCCQGYGGGANGSRTIVGYCENFDLHEAAPANAVDGLYMWNGSARIQFERDDDSPLRIWTGTERQGIALVDAGDANATAYAIWTGSARKYWKKYNG